MTCAHSAANYKVNLIGLLRQYFDRKDRVSLTRYRLQALRCSGIESLAEMTFDELTTRETRKMEVSTKQAAESATGSPT